MQLRVGERLMLLDLVPKEGDITTLRLVRELQDGLGFSAEELEQLQFVREGTSVQWKQDADKAKEVEIGTVAKALIADRLRVLEQEKKLNISYLALYERFVSDEEPESDSPPTKSQKGK